MMGKENRKGLIKEMKSQQELEMGWLKLEAKETELKMTQNTLSENSSSWCQERIWEAEVFSTLQKILFQ